MAVIAVYSYNAEFNSVRKEIKNGMVSPYAYLIAKTVIELPIMFVFAIFSLAIPGYAIANFNGSNFFPYMILFAGVMYSWETMAEMFAVQFANPLMGMMAVMGQW